MPMDTIPLLNKQAGGVKVKLLEDFTSVDPQMKKGRKMILNDTQAYHYIHDRYGVGDEENTSRMKRQRQYLGSLVKKIKKQAASDKKILGSYNERVESICGFKDKYKETDSLCRLAE